MVYKDGMEAEFAETIRLHELKIKQEKSKQGKIGTVGFKATERNKDWLTLTHAPLIGPTATQYSPKAEYVQTRAPGYTGY